MPFDPTPIETKHDVFSLEGLIAWLEKQPADVSYVWSDTSDCNGGCLIHRYLRDNDADPTWDYGKFAECLGERTMDIKVAMPQPWTYGAALARARALQGVG